MKDKAEKNFENTKLRAEAAYLAVINVQKSDNNYLYVHIIGSIVSSLKLKATVLYVKKPQ